MSGGLFPPPNDLRAVGISRYDGDQKALTVAFDRKPTDDEMRAVHDFLRHGPFVCHGCGMPHYSLPCPSCFKGFPEPHEREA